MTDVVVPSVEAAPRPDGRDSGEPGDRLINRELSWLEFNGRVLDLAADSTLPLLERVFFCSIFSSNLDEFFMVRVAGLLRQEVAGVTVRSVDGRSAQRLLADVRERALELVDRQGAVWHDGLSPELEEHGIAICSVGDCSEAEIEELEHRFEREIYPVLTPLAVGPGQPFPYISGLSLSLAVVVRNPATGEERLARVKVPEGLPRYVAVGKRGRLVPMEDVIRHRLDRLFPGMEIVEGVPFRVTRDADFEVSDEADDLLEAVELEIRRRRFGGVVRLEIDDQMSERMLAELRDGLGIDEPQIYRVRGMLDLADLSEIARFDRPDLRFEPWVPVTQKRLAGAEGAALFDEISRGDMLVHHPYDVFGSSVTAFVGAASTDEDAIGVKATVYRTDEESPIMPALIEASYRGKQSVCLVELKARFDEERNIEWSRALERAGVHVAYGQPNMKIHAKTILVVRREGDTLRRYVHVGTGNYHAATARVYEDFGLFTADEDIAADIADLFNHLTGFGYPQRFRKILVAPFTLRSRLIDEIRSVAAAASEGQPARIKIKVNALTDPAIIDELYAASQTGVEVDLITRGICALRPGVPGMSETIRVRSIVGRFLEHSRVFIFEADGVQRVFMGSADLMPRNLDHRIEVVAPVEDPAVAAELESVVDTLLADNVTAWSLRAGGAWERLRPEPGEREKPSQPALMQRARARTGSR